MWCSVVGCIVTLTLSLLVAPLATGARQPAQVHRIGVLMFTSQPFAMGEMRQGLHELGYVEGQNLTLEGRSAEGNVERRADRAAESVRRPGALSRPSPGCCQRGASGARAAGSAARHHDAPDCGSGHDRPGTGRERRKPGTPGW